MNPHAAAVREPLNLAWLREFFAARAPETDAAGGDVRPGLEFLGEHGLLDLGAGSDSGPELVSAIELLECLAGECLSSAFSLWAHRMVLEYLARGQSSRLTKALGARLRAGELIGSTAMAPALRDVAGIEPVPVTAEPVANGLRLNGPISWASNLFPGAVLVLPVRLPDDGRAVVLIRAGDTGVQIKPPPRLLALNATASSSVRLCDVDVPSEAVLSTDLAGFVASFRRGFLLLQTAFCTGVAVRSLAEAQPRARGPNVELAGAVATQHAAVDNVRTRLRELARDTQHSGIREFVGLRLEGARLAVRAAQLESTVLGGAGYVAASATSRRLRETAFLPIQAPTEGHLRWELRNCV